MPLIFLTTKLKCTGKMQDESAYLTIEGPAEAVYTQSGSRFMCFAYPVQDKPSVKKQLEALKNCYPDATHHCYAWVLKPDRSQIRFNDDGEPANSAGRPILRQIQQHRLTGILVVVVRYFGGKKLGIPGLIEAYGAVAGMCIQNAVKVEKTILDCFLIRVPATEIHQVYNLARKFEAEILSVSHPGKTEVELAIKKSKTKSFLNSCAPFHSFEITNLRIG